MCLTRPYLSIDQKKFATPTLTRITLKSIENNQDLEPLNIGSINRKSLIEFYIEKCKCNLKWNACFYWQI